MNSGWPTATESGGLTAELRSGKYGAIRVNCKTAPNIVVDGAACWALLGSDGEPTSELLPYKPEDKQQLERHGYLEIENRRLARANVVGRNRKSKCLLLWRASVILVLHE